jgi:hypothetical protein
MDSRIKRRDFLSGITAVAFVSTRSVQSFGQATPEMGAPSGPEKIAMGLINGVLGYIGETAFEQAMGLSVEAVDLRPYIRQAVAEVKKFVRQEIIKDINENELVKMEAAYDALVRNINNYSVFMPAEQVDNRYLIQDAELRSNELRALAQQFGVPSALIFVQTISLRTFITAVNFKRTHSRALLINHFNEIKAASEYLLQLQQKSMNAAAPETRLADDFIQCRRVGGTNGSGFGVVSMLCEFKIDGEVSPESTAAAPENDDSVEQKTWNSANALFNQKWAQFEKDARDLYAFFRTFDPITAKWFKANYEMRRQLPECSTVPEHEICALQ